MAVPIVWNRWTFEPSVVIPILLALAVYAVGVFRRRAATNMLQIWRHVSFAAGIGTVYASLGSPLDGLAQHLFWADQIQDLMLRMVGPMLIALSMPGAILIAAMPSVRRRGVRAPSAGNRALGLLCTVSTNAWVVTALFIASLFVWQYPALHDAAILDSRVRYLMSVTMLAAGLLFWRRIFDMRSALAELGYGTQVIMLGVTALAQIGLGGYLALQGTALYPAYDVVGRLFGINALTDQVTGAFIIWVPSVVMLLISAIIIIHVWGKQEERAWAARPTWTASNSEAMRYPTTGAALIEMARPKNRKLAISVVGVVFAVFAMTMVTGVLYHLNSVEHDAAGSIYAGQGLSIH